LFWAFFRWYWCSPDKQQHKLSHVP